MIGSLDTCSVVAGGDEGPASAASAAATAAASGMDVMGEMEEELSVRATGSSRAVVSGFWAGDLDPSTVVSISPPFVSPPLRTLVR